MAHYWTILKVFVVLGRCYPMRVSCPVIVIEIAKKWTLFVFTSRHRRGRIRITSLTRVEILFKWQDLRQSGGRTRGQTLTPIPANPELNVPRRTFQACFLPTGCETEWNWLVSTITLPLLAELNGPAKYPASWQAPEWIASWQQEKVAGMRCGTDTRQGKRAFLCKIDFIVTPQSIVEFRFELEALEGRPGPNRTYRHLSVTDFQLTRKPGQDLWSYLSSWQILWTFYSPHVDFPQPSQ